MNLHGAYAKCSPGTQLAQDTIEYSVRQGLSRYEFLGSEEAWQHAWPVERRAAWVELIWRIRGPASVAGRAVCYADAEGRAAMAAPLR